jgi:PhnB protein
MILQPYLNFDGQAEAALQFYAECFGGEITALNRFGEAPMEIPESHKNRIMHGEVVFDNNRIAVSDIGPGMELKTGNQYSMMITLMEVFILEDVFNKVARGGTVTMPLQDTFWGARFGTITDKFGINWMFSCDLN